jgi:hypothetical protein
MSRYVLPLVVVAVLISACASPGLEWAAKTHAIRAQCEDQFLSGTLKTHLATEQCANSAIRDMAVAAQVQDIDILDAYLAKREMYAAQLDTKVITAEEEKALIATARMESNSELQRRTNGRIGAAAAMMSTMPVTCTTIGVSTTCN